MNLPAFNKHIEGARLSVLEHALVGFVEETVGRVPDDESICANSQHIQFSDTPLTVFEKDGHRFTNFFVWGLEHVAGHGFLNPKNPLELSIVRIREEDWPTALRLRINELRRDRTK